MLRHHQEGELLDLTKGLKKGSQGEKLRKDPLSGSAGKTTWYSTKTQPVGINIAQARVKNW